jgi:hypothetical protein
VKDRKKKTYTAKDIAVAREQGRKEAEEYLQRRINNVYITNHNLLVEILRLDWSKPVTGVIIPYAYVVKLIKKLRKKNMLGHAKRLEGFIVNSNIANEDVLSLLECLGRKPTGQVT